ncbi:unnamed protein product [Linum trigynum]|uniref:Retrotransposon Copia-like N-terminal domain-containing protein n=1 Tax=Linum trigynum TaxID=586398 RepID=A0AAV2F358_9ROSI
MADNQAAPQPQPDPQPQDPQRPNVVDPASDPFFLHGSEQPGSLLVDEKLTTTNYNDWSRAMLNALAAKNKLSFINASIPELPVTDPRHGAWTRTQRYDS